MLCERDTVLEEFRGAGNDGVAKPKAERSRRGLGWGEDSSHKALSGCVSRSPQNSMRRKERCPVSPVVREVTSQVISSMLGSIFEMHRSIPYPRHPKEEFLGLRIMHPNLKRSLQLTLIKTLP